MGGKKGGKKGGDKKFTMLSEDDDMEDMKKAMEEFEKAGPKEKEAMLEEGKKAMKEEGMSDEEVEKAVGMFEKGELDDLMKMKKEMEKKHGKKGELDDLMKMKKSK